MYVHACVCVHVCGCAAPSPCQLPSFRTPARGAHLATPSVGVRLGGRGGACPGWGGDTVRDPWPQPGCEDPQRMFRRPPKARHQGRRDGRPPPGADGVKGPRWELGTLTWALPVATAQRPTWCLRPSSGHWILPFPELPLYALGSSEEVPAHLPARHTPIHPSEPCSGPFQPVHCVGEGLALGIQTPAPSPSVRLSSRCHLLGRSNRAAVVSRGGCLV